MNQSPFDQDAIADLEYLRITVEVTPSLTLLPEREIQTDLHIKTVVNGEQFHYKHILRKHDMSSLWDHVFDRAKEELERTIKAKLREMQAT